MWEYSKETAVYKFSRGILISGDPDPRTMRNIFTSSCPVCGILLKQSEQTKIDSLSKSNRLNYLNWTVSTEAHQSPERSCWKHCRLVFPDRCRPHLETPVIDLVPVSVD